MGTNMNGPDVYEVEALLTPKPYVVGRSSSTWLNGKVGHMNTIPRSQWSIWKALKRLYGHFMSST